MVHSKDEGNSETWSVFLVFDRNVTDFSCYDGIVDKTQGQSFKIEPKAWNAESKSGTERRIGFGLKWPQLSPEPKLMSLTINGVPYTCVEGTEIKLSCMKICVHGYVLLGDIVTEQEETSNEGAVIEVDIVEEEVIENESGSTQEVVPVVPVVPVELPENTDSPRGVFVAWPKKVDNDVVWSFISSILLGNGLLYPLG